MRRFGQTVHVMLPPRAVIDLRQHHGGHGVVNRICDGVGVDDAQLVILADQVNQPARM